MAETTPIQWCDGTVNPTMGCDGCELWNEQRRSCYAGREHLRKGAINRGYSPRFETLTVHAGRTAEAACDSSLLGENRLDKPWLNGLPRMIFVSDMSDALSKSVPFSYLRREIVDVAVSRNGRRHLWLWLTKRPGRMAKFARYLEGLDVPWPRNLWAGTSITTQDTLSRAKQLLEVPADVRFLSVEPQDEDIDLDGQLEGIHWVIQGGESGPEARRFDLEWADRMREQCRSAGVPYFLKQLGKERYENGARIKLLDSHGGDWSEWPERLKVREVPKTDV